jgi:hypothetical protein
MDRHFAEGLARMIRSKLFRVMAGFGLFIAGGSSAVAQSGAYCPPGHPPLIQLPQSHYQPPLIDHQIQPHPKLWDDQQPIEHFLHEVASRSWLRLEYLNWTYRRPGDSIVGSDVSGLQLVIPQPSGGSGFLREGTQTPVEINDNLNGGNSVGETLFPTMHTIGKQDVPGIRGTLGVALNGADLEMSFFGMEQTGDSFTQADISGPREILNAQVPTIDPALGTLFNPNYAIPLLTDGAVTDVTAVNALIFNDSLNIELESQLWGSEIILLTEKQIPGGEGHSWQWLSGIRYLNLDEKFTINGSFDGFGLVPDSSTRIQSKTVNNLYGLEVGARAAWTTRWFTLSATPRTMFGLNDYTATVNADPLGLGNVRTGDESVDFGFAAQLNLLAEVHLNNHFSLYGGYDFLWLPRVTRPDENIVYDSTNNIAGGFTPNITEHTNFSHFIAQGLSVGCVFRY